MNSIIVAATEADCLDLAANIRDQDRAEVVAAVGLEPIDVLRHSLGGYAYAARDERGTALMFGAYPTDTPDVGLIWLLATPRIVEKRLEFLRRARPVLDVLHRHFPLLINHADARNDVHVAWLKWCGFRIVRTIPMAGVAGIPFHEIARFKRIECVPQ